jgi:hydrogenase maturation protease
MTEAPRILLLGIGNVLWADEGFGVRCAEAFAGCYAPHPQVTVLDGGTQGLLLVDYVRAADKLIVFDAVDLAAAPGTPIEARGDDIPRLMFPKQMSLHQTGFQDVLGLAELFGQTPDEIVLLGVQHGELEDYGGSLTPAVRAQIDPAVERAAAIVAAWGVNLSPGADPLAQPDRALALESYEQGRPSAEDACRSGDERVLALTGLFAPDPQSA